MKSIPLTLLSCVGLLASCMALERSEGTDPGAAIDTAGAGL
jgi:hypothetical protein